MNRLAIAVRTIGIVTIIILTFACSSGDGGGNTNTSGGSNGADDNPNRSDDTAAVSLSSGMIEGFGSIIVNGIEFETEGAQIQIENEDTVTCSPSASDDCGLHIGMMVTLENAFDDSGNPTTVTRISYDDTLEGPVSAFAEVTPGLVKTLTVMGQTVILESGVTRFDDADTGFDAFDDVGPGNVNNLVEVSGHVDFDGSIRATYIERKGLAPLAGDQFEVNGTVTNLDLSASTFQVNDLTIDFNGIIPRNGTLANGRQVEVKGDTLIGNTLQATDVEVKLGGLNIDDIAKAQIEGFVANLDTTAQSFEVNGQAIDFSGAFFVGGSEADLAEGVKLEVEGPVVNLVLQAVKVVFKHGFRFEANVDAIDTTAGILTLEALTGVTVQIDGLTVFDGFGGLDDLTSGNHLSIRGRRSTPTSSTVIASEIDLIDTAPDDRATIQGRVDNFVPFSSVEILGVSVNTATIENDDFKDRDSMIGETEFFNRLSIGDLVKARIDLRSGEWDQIEFEDD